MKSIIVALCLLMGVASAQAQVVDVLTTTADKSTRMFSDGQNTVPMYVNYMIETKTNCCGRDDIFISVTTDKDGWVSDLRVMTGSNPCIKEAVADIVRFIKWENTDDTPAGKQFFFPIKVMVECEDDKDNQYAAITPPEGWQGPGATLATADKPKPKVKEETQPAKEQLADATTKAEEAVEEAEDAVEETVEEAKEQLADAKEVVKEETKEVAKETPKETAPKPKKELADATAPKKTPETRKPQDLPPGVTDDAGRFNVPQVSLPNPVYESAGELQPDESHIDTYANLPGPVITPPTYKGGRRALAVYVRQALRKQDICGLSHVLAELTVAPDGAVSEFRIFAANSEPVYAALPAIFKGLQFNSTGSRIDQHYMLEFKTDIQCEDRPMIDLESIPNYLVTENKRSVKDMDTSNISRPTDN